MDCKLITLGVSLKNKFYSCLQLLHSREKWTVSGLSQGYKIKWYESIFSW